MVYHGPAFALDAVFRVAGHLDLSAGDVWKVRSKCLLMHNDFQTKFFWLGFLKWARVDKEDVIPLAHEDLSNPIFAEQMRNILLPLVIKPTFCAIYSFSLHLVDYDKTFADKNGLPHIFFRLVFTTLAPMMFRLIESERRLNADNPGQEEKDKTMCGKIIKAYLAMTLDPQFEGIDLDKFI